MIYFDTDVWIQSLVNQNEEKHIQANNIIKTYNQQGYILSSLNLQEIIFVLGKLKIDRSKIYQIMAELFQLNIVDYSLQEIKRATIIAKEIGYRQINDCIHTAIAEKYFAELITYNKKDFVKIKELTHIKVKIL